MQISKKKSQLQEFSPLDWKEMAYFRFKNKEVKEEFSGSSPAPFIGRFGYPNVNAGFLTPPGITQSWLYDAPRYWAKANLKIERIVEFRSDLVNSQFKIDVRRTNSYLDVVKEVGMASKPVELEVQLEQKPLFRINTHNYVAPIGPNARLKKVEITANTKIHRSVDKVVDDTDLKAADAIIYLNDRSFDENQLAKTLSVGVLGLKKNRKLVPTRWSITAVDDTLSKNLLQTIREFRQADYQLYFGSYLGNYYLILLFPGNWGYELFEMYAPAMKQSRELTFHTDFEGFAGRKDYAKQCTGGYYTVRLAIAEKLMQLKRQAGVLALRLITDEYKLPLGVWVTREASRKCLAQKAIEFSSKELMIGYLKAFMQKKFLCNVEHILKKSMLLNSILTQSRLSDF